MEDGQEALDSVEDKLASVFASEMGLEAPAETPEPEAVEEPAEPVAVAEGEFQAPDPPPITPQPENTPAPQAEERLRDPETGQFTTEERLYAGRYKTVEDLERAVEEKEAFIQRQGTDVGSLRSELQSLREALETRREEPAPQPQALPGNWENLLDEDPAAAAQYAYEAGDQGALTEAVKVWNEVSPGAPRLWAQNIELTERVSSLSENFGQQSTNAAYQEFARQHPDMDQYAGRMAEIAKESPHLTGLLQSPDPSARVEVLDYLYTKASSEVRARNADTLAKAQSAADAEKNALLRQQKETAAVASATRTAVEKKPLNEGQAFLQSVREVFHSTPDIMDGITTD